jgi:hypothetical protein
MNKLLKFTKGAFAMPAIAILVFLTACPPEKVKPIVDPEIYYPPTTIEVGSTGTITPEIIAGSGIITYAITDVDDADFVTINPSTGELTIAAESTTGEYTVKVTATNDGQPGTADAYIHIGVNEDFDPTGESLLWKYWMNHTEGVVMLNLNLLPGQEGLPAEIPIPTGWPANWPAIDMQDPTLESYFVFPTVQYFLQQVPGDDVCGELEPAEEGDTLLLIVNTDLTLSTQCKNAGSMVYLGTSSISYSGGAYSWTLNLTLQGVPVAIEIGGAEITTFTDPMDPHWTSPIGVPRTFPAVVGTVEQYMTPTDFHPDNYLTSIQLLNVDVVLEILQ